VEKARSPLGGGFMRSVYEIQREIAQVSNKLNNLILEKKITLQVMWSYEKNAEKLAEKVIEKMKETR
jgi:hypothetical protein